MSAPESPRARLALHLDAAAKLAHELELSYLGGYLAGLVEASVCACARDDAGWRAAGGGESCRTLAQMMRGMCVVLQDRLPRSASLVFELRESALAAFDYAAELERPTSPIRLHSAIEPPPAF